MEYFFASTVSYLTIVNHLSFIMPITTTTILTALPSTTIFATIYSPPFFATSTINASTSMICSNFCHCHYLQWKYKHPPPTPTKKKSALPLPFWYFSNPLSFSHGDLVEEVIRLDGVLWHFLLTIWYLRIDHVEFTFNCGFKQISYWS